MELIREFLIRLCMGSKATNVTIKKEKKKLEKSHKLSYTWGEGGS